MSAQPIYSDDRLMASWVHPSWAPDCPSEHAGVRDDELLRRQGLRDDLDQTEPGALTCEGANPPLGPPDPVPAPMAKVERTAKAAAPGEPGGYGGDLGFGRKLLQAADKRVK